MANKERENFYRGSTLIVDNTKTSFVDLLELHLSRNNISFEDFITQHQHQIYHLYYTKKCCHCFPGFNLPNKRILYYPQLEILFDKNAKKTGHTFGNRSDFCCARTKTGITTDVLDITLTRSLLVNFCHDVFWYSCLTLQSQSLPEFLNKNKHHIYHLREPNIPCCQCPPGFIFPVTDPLIDLQSWKVMFNLSELPCPLHRMVPSDFACTVSASRGIEVRHLGDQLTEVLIEQCCPLRQTIEKLILIRNKVQGHTSDGRISDADYGGYTLNITSGIMEVAKVCRNEASTMHSLADVSKRSLDETLCIQYQNVLLEQIQKEKRLEEKIDDLAVQIPTKIELTLNNALRNTIPDMVEQSVQSALKKIYEPNSKLTIDQQRSKTKLLEDTLTLIKCHSSEDTFVETNAIAIALHELENKGVIVLTGTAGTGKSRNSLEIIRRFSAAHDGYCGIKLNNISEWIEIINDKDYLIVLLDDVFGRTNCIFNAEDEKFFDIIHSMVVQGFVKVIFTMRNTIRSDQQVSDIIDRQRIFQKSRFIDLSSTQIEMKEKQKRECLLKYCKLKNISISDTKQVYDDKQVLDHLVPMFLSEDEINEISIIDINPLMGYPESCFLFTSHRKFTRLGVGFFKHPTSSLCNEIKSLRNAGNSDEEMALQYATLVYMALNEDVLDLYDIKIHKFNKIHEFLYHKKDFTAHNLRRGLGQLVMRYLRTNPNGTYSFQHRSIFEGVLLSYKDIETKSLIPLLHIDFILEMCRLDRYIPNSEVENEVTMLFNKDHYNMLAKKIISELRKNDSIEIFIEKLCSSRIMRNTDKYFIDELYKEYKLSRCAIYCTLRHLDGEKECEIYTSEHEIVYTPSKRTSVSFLTLLLKYSIKYVDNDDTMCQILKLMQHGLDIDKNIYINESHEKCFTEAILQSCAYLSKHRLNMFWKFMTRNMIRFDRETFLLFNLGPDNKIAALKLLSSTVLTSDLIDTNAILTKAIECNNTPLVELIFKHQNSSEIDVPSALYYACAYGAELIVQWFLKHFQQEEFDIGKAFLEATKGLIDPPTAFKSYQFANISDTRNVVVFLLKNYRDSIYNLENAMQIALSHSRFNICKLLMENTQNVFNAEAILTKVGKHKNIYRKRDCLSFVKYLVSVCSCLNVDVLLEIAKHCSNNLSMVEWIMTITENEIFYKAWTKHKWIHRNICALKLIYDTEFYKTLDETSVIDEELRYGNNDCIRFLWEKFDMQRFEKEIVQNVCSCGDYDLMQKIFKNVCNLNIENAMNIAVTNHNLKAVKCICTNFDKQQLNFESIIKVATSCAVIPIIRYFIEIFDTKYFNFMDILAAIKSKGSLKNEDDHLFIFKWCLQHVQDTKYIYRINELLKMPAMKYKKYTQLLFQNCESKFLHLNIAVKTVLMSRDFDSLKYLLIKYDINVFDMNFIMNCIWTKNEKGRDADDITKWLLENFDPKLFNITYILEMASYDDNLPFIQWMYCTYGISDVILEAVFIHACKSSTISILQWIIERITRPIDYKKILEDVLYLSSSAVIFFIHNFELDQSDIDKICKLHWRHSQRRLDFKLCIFETYGMDLIDVKSVFDSVCLFSSVQETKWFLNKVDKRLLSFLSAIKEALRGNNDETFMLLFDFINVNDQKEVDGIFIEACRYGNLLPVEFLHNKCGEYLSISVAIHELCQNKSLTQKHFDVFRFLIKFSSPSILNCQLLMNWACKSHDMKIIRWLLNFFDPDIFEVCSALCHAFDTYFTTDRQLSCRCITMEILGRCQWVSSDIQAVMEIVCSKGMVLLMKLLVKEFGPGCFDFQRIVSIALNPMNKDIFEFAFSQSNDMYIDLQNVFISACENADDEALEVIKMFLFKLDVADINSIIHAILQLYIPYRQAFINKVIKILLQYREYNDKKPTNIMSVIRKCYTSVSQTSLLETNNLVLWIHDNCMYSLIDMPEIMLAICRSGDIHSIKYLLNTWNYRNLINTSCIQTAFSGGSIELIEMMINDFPDIPFDKKVAMNNASLSGDISVVQWLFYKYSIRPNRFQFLEPILDLKLALAIFDLNSAMWNACRNGKKDFVQWLLQIYSDETFDMKSCLNEASASGETDLVKWMLAVYDNDIFDIETSFNIAGKNGKFRVLEFLIEKFGKAAFDIDTVTTEACRSGNLILVKWIHKTFDRKLYNIKSAMLTACVNDRSNVVRWIIKNFDHSYFNM